MLDFIVLGLIPGTRFQITFTWIMATAMIFVLGMWAMVEFLWIKPHRRVQQSAPETISTLEQLSFPV